MSVSKSTLSMYACSGNKKLADTALTAIEYIAENKKLKEALKEINSKLGSVKLDKITDVETGTALSEVFSVIEQLLKE